MGVFDFFRGSKEQVSFSTAHFDELLQAIVKEANAKKTNSYSQFKPYASLDSFKPVDSLSGEDKRAFLSFLCDAVFKPDKNSTNYFSDTGHHAIKLIPFLLKSMTLQDDDFTMILNFFKKFRNQKTHYYSFQETNVPIVEALGQFVRKEGLTPVRKDALTGMLHDLNDYSAVDYIKANEQILFLLQGDTSVEINGHDQWGAEVIPFLKQSPTDVKNAWTKLFAHAKKLDSKSVPTQKWVKEAMPMVEAIGHDAFAIKMQEWLTQTKAMLQEVHKSKEPRYDFLRSDNHEVLKGLVWCCGLLNNKSLHATLDDYAAWAYKKKPGLGSISAKTGTAAMFAFSQLPVKEGVSRLSKFKMKIKNNTILKSIDKIIREVATKNNITIDSLQELAVPDFGIQENDYSMEFGECKGIYNLARGEITWQRQGKFQKSIPSEIKENFKLELKAFKNNIKEIEALLPVIKNRLEQTYLLQRTWSFETWTSLYIDHPLSSQIATKLIWHFSKDDKKAQGIFANGEFVTVHGQPISWLDNDVSVQLWHPIGFSSDEIVAWRRFLKERQIIQPFKQAYREVYIVTDAELTTDTYSNRFAAHILRQHQFAALCRQRAWHYQLMGTWDSHNTPYVELPHWQLTADWNNATNAANQMGVFNYITTDQVRFIRGGNLLPVHEVPALVFSEVMRDVDLFVGVTSIGNDSMWQDGGDNFQNTYWHEYSFSDLSESAKIRSQVLESLVPSLKIASQCTFDKKFLIVKGKIRTYKIHMGSGNILMEPDDLYLCIVPGGQRNTKEKVFLPFEGDSLLSIIISKAFLLAADDKITDPTITRQIKR